MDPEGVSVPWIHEHPMMPWSDSRIGDCCGRFDSVSDGYYCKSCDYFIHKKCGDKPSYESIQHPSHPDHPLQLHTKPHIANFCDVCRKRIVSQFYRCEICDFDIDLYCGRYTPPDVIDVSEMHYHILTLFKRRTEFVCDAKCGKSGDDEFSYECYECDISFHIDCVWHPSEVKHMSEVNHSHHPWHPLKLHKGQLPDYCDGKCRFCGRTICDEIFYHCSACKFSLDMCCALDPPPLSIRVLKAHDHQLTLLPRIRSFTCNACGLSGDHSPYICVQCDFMIHQGCLGLPRVIKINRHDHRIVRTSILGVVNSVCGVCHLKVDWDYGGYSCQRCSDYVVHSKCATRKDVWNGKELERVPEEKEDLQPFVVIDSNTIQHFSHSEHYLRLYVNGIIYEEDKRCNACIQPIYLQSFYGCLDCDFILHQNCAESPKKKWHVLHNEQLTLDTSKHNIFLCHACRRWSNGFVYHHGKRRLDIHCSAISEPFSHLSHPHHPLYYIPSNVGRLCNGCNVDDSQVQLTCIEDGCGFSLCFKCATLPQVVKHRVDNHPLSLCYGEKASGKYWCDICEKETNPKIWFYTCKDHRASLHVECVFGDFARLMPKSALSRGKVLLEVVLNNSASRPFCGKCKLRCIYPIILKTLENSGQYLCSLDCLFSLRLE